MRCSNTYSRWEEEGRSKFVLQYHEKGLRENKQCKKVDPGYMKMIEVRKTKKDSSLNPYAWVLLQARSWGKLRNLFDPISVKSSVIEDTKRTKCAKKATSSGSKDIFLRESTRATTTSRSYDLWKPDTRISNSNEKHREHRGQDNANNECQENK